MAEVDLEELERLKGKRQLAARYWTEHLDECEKCTYLVAKCQVGARLNSHRINTRADLRRYVYDVQREKGRGVF